MTRGGWLVLLALASLTHLQASRWLSDVALWEAAVVVTPTKPRPWINLGAAREASGDPASARLAYEQALMVMSDTRRPPGVDIAATAIASTNLARWHAAFGKPETARRYLRTALTIAPLFAPALVMKEWICGLDDCSARVP